MANNLDVTKIKILSCGIRDCDENWHWDTGEGGFCDYDLWTVFRGRGALTYGGVRWEASVGDSLLLTPNNRCIGEQDINDRLLTINVHFNFTDGEKPTYPIKGGAVYRRMSDISYMHDLLYRVILLFNAGKTEFAEAVFSSALVEFFEQKNISDQTQYGKDKAELVRKICDMINTSPSSVPPLTELSDMFGYSPDYLGRVFSAVTGVKMSEYIKNARINQAKLLLSSTHLTVEAIALSLGYYDACYFSRQFRQATGYTPNGYRKNKQ